MLTLVGGMLLYERKAALLGRINVLCSMSVSFAVSADAGFVR